MENSKDKSEGKQVKYKSALRFYQEIADTNGFSLRSLRMTDPKS
jgi:hypothetical protein